MEGLQGLLLAVALFVLMVWVARVLLGTRGLPGKLDDVNQRVLFSADFIVQAVTEKLREDNHEIKQELSALRSELSRLNSEVANLSRR